MKITNITEKEWNETETARALDELGTELPGQSETIPSEEWLDCLSALKNARVLVVDDEADIRDFLTAALHQFGAQVYTAESAAEALDIIKQLRPDILVSDIGMPVEDGYALIRKVRALGAEQGGGIPAIALTAYDQLKDRQRALAAGYQMHVPKMVSPIELAVIIASLLKTPVRM